MLVATLEGWGGRYSCTFPVAQFTMFDCGRILNPVRARMPASDGDELGWFLCHPDDDLTAAVGGGDWVGPGLAHEYAYGRSARAGGVTITKLSRTVYDNKGVILPADQRAPVPGDYFHQAYGPGVLIGTTVWLLDTLWQRAWVRVTRRSSGIRTPAPTTATLSLPGGRSVTVERNRSLLGRAQNQRHAAGWAVRLAVDLAGGWAPAAAGAGWDLADHQEHEDEWERESHDSNHDGRWRWTAPHGRRDLG